MIRHQLVYSVVKSRYSTSTILHPESLAISRGFSLITFMKNKTRGWEGCCSTFLFEVQSWSSWWGMRGPKAYTLNKSKRLLYNMDGMLLQLWYRKWDSALLVNNFLFKHKKCEEILTLLWTAGWHVPDIQALHTQEAKVIDFTGIFWRTSTTTPSGSSHSHIDEPISWRENNKNNEKRFEGFLVQKKSLVQQMGIESWIQIIWYQCAGDEQPSITNQESSCDFTTNSEVQTADFLSREHSNHRCNFVKYRAAPVIRVGKVSCLFSGNVRFNPPHPYSAAKQWHPPPLLHLGWLNLSCILAVPKSASHWEPCISPSQAEYARHFTRPTQIPATWSSKSQLKHHLDDIHQSHTPQRKSKELSTQDTVQKESTNSSDVWYRHSAQKAKQQHYAVEVYFPIPALFLLCVK